MTSSIFRAFIFVATLSLAISVAAEGRKTQDLANLVNVMVGTADEGQTFPAANMPFAMTEWTPQTRSGEIKCVSPYYFGDTKIQGFRGTHFLSGSCTQDYGSMTLMPLASDEHLAPVERASTFSHTGEGAHPYEYAVDLKDSGIHAEISGTQRSGVMRFRFKPGQHTGWVVVDNNSRASDAVIQIDPERQEITGINPVLRIYAGSGKSAGFSGYFVVQFSRRFKAGGTTAGKERAVGSLQAISRQEPVGAYVSFDLGKDTTVLARIGTSFVSIEEARRNLREEIPDWNFDTVAKHTHRVWNERLSKIEVHGNSADRRILYTALYHTMLAPHIFSDRSGTYPGFSGTSVKRASNFTYYDDFSVWDTFRAVHPLLTILDPGTQTDMVRSLIAKGQEGGYLPIFPMWDSYTSAMVGDHVDVLIADAYAKGLRGFDAEAAYQLMRKNALETPNAEDYKDGKGRRSLASYLKYGYIPLEDHVLDAFHKNEQVSRTLEYAFDDFQVAQMARALGRTDDAQLFSKRAQNYRNVIDPETGFARGRHADGSWDKPFDPAGKYTYITEGLPFQYTFFAPQDLPGLIQATGGREAFIRKLDALFAGKYYDHGNEPSHHIAYLYDYAGEPWKTQEHIHTIMGSEYREAPAGLAGNDDAGQMSAWYVMSALGFYAVTPGTSAYAIGTPRFDFVTVHLPNGKMLEIHAEGAESGKFYIRSIHWNGKPVTDWMLQHSQIAGGGNLVFEMSATPVRLP